MTSRDGNAYRDGRVYVAAEKCRLCIFRPGNPMHLEPGRVKDMVDESVETGGAIVCHSTIDDDRDDAICRGFHDAHGYRVPALRLAEALRIVRTVDADQRE